MRVEDFIMKSLSGEMDGHVSIPVWSVFAPLSALRAEILDAAARAAGDDLVVPRVLRALHLPPSYEATWRKGMLFRTRGRTVYTDFRPLRFRRAEEGLVMEVDWEELRRAVAWWYEYFWKRREELLAR